MAQADGALGGFAHRGKSLGQQLIQALALRPAAAEFSG